jgi:hypothetical protein
VTRGSSSASSASSSSLLASASASHEHESDDDSAAALASSDPVVKAVNAAIGEGVRISGNLYKTSSSTNALGFKAGWKTRWCKIENACMSYHRNAKSEPKGVIPLYMPGVVVERVDHSTFLVSIGEALPWCRERSVPAPFTLAALADQGGKTFRFVSMEKDKTAQTNDVDRWVAAAQQVVDAAARIAATHDS